MSIAARRSKRHQPSVLGASTSATRQTAADNWASVVLYSRPTISSDLPGFPTISNSEDEDETPQATTRFYSSFLRHSGSKPPVRTRNKVTSRGRTSKKDGETHFNVGDTVLVRTGIMKTSVAVITGMWEVIGEVSEVELEDEHGKPNLWCGIHWFVRPRELPRNRFEREHYENEIYYTADGTAIIASSSIVTHCNVTTVPPDDGDKKSTTAWAGSPAKRGRTTWSVTEEHDEKLYCGHVTDTQRGLYYSFNWVAHHTRALAVSRIADESTCPEWMGAGSWNVLMSEYEQRWGNKLSRIAEDKEDNSDRGDSGEEFIPGQEQPPSSDEDVDTMTMNESDEGIVFAGLRTPSKKREHATTFTPRKRQVVNPTPRTKRVISRGRRARGPTVRLPPPETVSTARLPTDPWLRAMHVLHVAARPELLPCREEEFRRVMHAVEELLEEGSGGCIYISGVPGTGKTATVHAVVRELKRMAANNETNPFTYVEINGLRIPEPSVAYTVLWEALSGHDVAEDGPLRMSSKEALKHLTRHFGSGNRSGPGRYACVVLMDELDQLMTTKQDVVYNFFNWPTLVDSKLVVLAVANTMDLPERVMTGRVRSRLGMTRINFQPYTTQQLIEIVQSRLADAKEGLRGTVIDVMSPDAIKFTAIKVSSVSGDARRVLDICRRTVELVQPHKRRAKVPEVQEVIRLMQNSLTASYIRTCSFHERVLLASLLKCMKREGVDEIRWGDVQHQHYLYVGVLGGDGDSTRHPTPTELTTVLDSLLSSHALLMEDSTRKVETDRRLILNLEQTEVERVLGDTGGQAWKNALGVS